MGWVHAQKNAIKSGIAFVLAFVLAIAFNWENPLWAGFAVFFPRMQYAGMTLHKSTLFTFGSFAAVVAATAIMAFAAESPWVALCLLSLWFAGCIYIARRQRVNYGFLIAGAVSLIIFVNVIFRPQDFYEIAYYRLAETCLGVTVGTLANALIWPELELPDIGKNFELLRLHCIDYMRTLADSIDGDGQTSAQLDHISADIGAQYSSLVALFVSAHRNTLNPSSLTAPSLMYFESRTLVRRLFALRQLVRSYVHFSHTASGPWFVAWLKAEANHLELMDWKRREKPADYRPIGEAHQIRRQIEQYISDKLPQIDDHFEAITSCVAARDLLLDVSEAAESMATSMDSSVEELDRRLAAQGELIGSAPPEESPRVDAWKAVTAAVSIFASGAIWFASQNPAAGIALVVAGISNLIYSMTRYFVATLCATGILIGLVAGFITFLVVMPQLDGVVQLSIALFVPAYVIALFREHSKYSLLGVWGFMAFCCLVVLQEQQPSFITSSERIFDSALAQGLGAAIAGIVI